METSVRTKKMIANVIAIVMVLAIISSIYFMITDKDIKKDLNGEKLKNEQLLSEKLAVDKEINQLKQTIQSLNGENAEVESLLASTKIKLAEKEKEIAGILKQNANVKSLQKQLTEIRQMKENLVKQVQELDARNQKLLAENQDLQNSVQRLTRENNDMAKQMETLKAQNLVKVDNYQVEAFRNVKKERITVRARRAKMIAITLDVPKEFAQDISFSITTPEGKIINEKDKSISWEIIPQDQYMMASLNSFGDELKLTNQVILTYHPTSRLKAGIYKIGIKNKQGEVLGNCRMHLK